MCMYFLINIHEFMLNEENIANILKKIKTAIYFISTYCIKNSGDIIINSHDDRYIFNTR